MKCGVQTLTDILVWWIGILIKKSHQIAVPCKAFLKDILRCNVSGEPPWALNFDSIVEHPDVDIISDAVVAMNNRVSYDLVDGLLRVAHSLESRRTKGGRFLNDTHRRRNCLADLLVSGALYRKRIICQRFPCSQYVSRLVPVYLDPAAFGYDGLGVFSEEENSANSGPRIPQ